MRRRVGCAPGSSRVTCSWKPKDSLCVALATCPKYERYPEWSVPSSRNSCGTLTNVRSETRKNHCTAAAGECGRLMILPTASM